MRKGKVRVGIVGATGLVGSEMLKVIESRADRWDEPVLWASERSAGQEVDYLNKTLVVEALNHSSFKNRQLDFVLFAGGGDVSATYAPLAAKEGAIVIDNSSHFRLDPQVPLIVPEVNPGDIGEAKSKGIIANPNCSTIQLVVVLKPLLDAAGLERVVVSTYQSVSGAGADAVDELEHQVRSIFTAQDFESKVFSKQIAFNVIPHIDVFVENGMSKEEMKIILESRKILKKPALKITATTVRVPVFIGHSESVNVDFTRDLSPEEAREVLRKAPGVRVIDEPGHKLYPTPVEISGEDEVFVGRIRRDESSERSLHLWIVADNLRKGAAWNAVQIAELCVDRGFSRLIAA